MKKTLSLVLAALMILFVIASCGDKQNDVDPNKKDEGVLTYDQYVALEDGKDAVIEGFVQYKTPYSADYQNASLYLADGTGAYYVYRWGCTQEEYDKLTAGCKVKVSGQKTSWSGEVEIAEASATVEVVGTDTYTAPVVDVTGKAEADLLKEMNKKVVFKGAEVVASTMKAEDGTETECAFLYKWDGSGSQGDDIYFNVKLGETTYNFVVETDISNKDSEAYKAVEALKVGDKVDLEGFLYWYNAPQLQVTACTAAQ